MAEEKKRERAKVASGQQHPCKRCESPLQAGEIRCAVCGQSALDQASRGDKLTIQVLRCVGCNAATAFDIASQGLRCAYCDSVVRVERVDDPMEQTELLLPFKVQREEAGKALKHWLGGLGFFRPGDLRQAARVESLRPLYWPAWIFEAEALVSWSADSEYGSGRSAWAPHAGQERLRFQNVAVSASRGLTEAETNLLAPSCDLSTALPIADHTGAEPKESSLEQFDVQRSQARARVSEAVQAASMSVIEADHVPGKRTRNLHVEPLLSELATRRYALPAWVMAYRYKDDVYRAVVSGQDQSCVIGKAPYSIAKIVLVILAVLTTLAIGIAILA